MAGPLHWDNAFHNGLKFFGSIIKNQSIFNIIRWVAGSMGQMTHRPSVWCSECYFFHNFLQNSLQKQFQFISAYYIEDCRIFRELWVLPSFLPTSPPDFQTFQWSGTIYRLNYEDEWVRENKSLSPSLLFVFCRCWEEHFYVFCLEPHYFLHTGIHECF